MGQDPAVIRTQIEQTREHMGDTVDALGYKADVPARAKESVSEKVDAIKARVGGLGSQVAEAAPEGSDVKEGAKKAVGIAQENPLGLAMGAAAVGFLAGMLAPHTKIEDERIGPLADEVRHQAQQTAQEAVEHGRQVVQETASVAGEKAQEALGEIKQTAQERAGEHADEVSQSAQDSVERVQEAARSAS